MPHAQTEVGRLYYEETGAGHPVIFCHEFAADHRTWEPQIRQLGRRYRCVTYNALGYAPSDVPENPQAYRWERQRDNIGALMDHLGIEKAHLVGLSMGAYSALQFAMAYPGRVTAVAFSSGGSGSAPVDRTPDPADMLAAADALLARGWEGGGAFMSAGPSRVQLRNKDPRGWAVFRDYLHEHSVVGSSLTLRNFQAVRPSLYGFSEELRRLRTPVLLMVGDEDDAVIEVNVFLKRNIPRSGLWMAPRTGHAMNLEEPAMYNRMLLEFFSDVEGGARGVRDPRSQPRGA